MSQLPPQLVALLRRLGLAAPGQIRQAQRHVRRLARDLPQFESVWIDALAQTRTLSPFQAAELSAGRGESLRLGPYLLCQPWGDCPWVSCYRARQLDSGEMVHLAVAEPGSQKVEELLPRLEALAATAKRLPTEHLAAIDHVGSEGGRIWAASRWVESRTAAQWMVYHGRLPPELVLEIARSMLIGLCALEKNGLCHGDIAAQSLLLTDGGGIVLLNPGLRAILRPEEGYAHADLQPEAYDYLSPQRITSGAPPDVAGDIYACGCLWWHLLCGRPPLAGGDGLTKLRAAHAGIIADVRHLAPETLGALAEAISTCIQPDPGCRPESMTRLAAMLGGPRLARRAVARRLGRCRRPAARWAAPARVETAAGRTSRWTAAASLGLIACVAICWPLWSRYERQRAAIPGHSTAQVATPVTSGRSPMATQPMNPAASPDRLAKDDLPPDMLLATDKPQEIGVLALRPGQCVRGALGRRPQVLAPSAGLVVAADGVRFENVDFLWKHASASAGAIVQLRAARCEFRGCTFQAAAGAPAAIAWVYPPEAAAVSMSLPGGRLRFSDCVLAGVGVAVDCRTQGPLGVEMNNTLHLGSGPVLRLDHAPKADEPLMLDLSRVTLRGTGPLLQCDCSAATGESPSGEISVQAAGCIFAPAAGRAVLLWSSPVSPQRFLKGVKWTGQGSLVLPDTHIAAWLRPDGAQQVLDESAASIAGLVSIKVEFAGGVEAGPQASRVTRGQAPSQSADSPGVDVDALPRPAGGRGAAK